MTTVISTLHEPQADDPLADAVQAYVAAKRAEDAATATRLAAEQRILALHPAKEEGAETIDAGGYRLTITGRMSYSCEDVHELAAACALAGVAENLVPVKVKRELDATGCKWLRANDPQTWGAVIAPHVTVKPAKPSLAVKV